MTTDDERPLIIFGTARLSSLAWYAYAHDSRHEVAGFVIDAAHRDGLDRLHDLPVVDFERAAERFPPDRYLMSVPLGWTGMNGLRRARYLAAREAGYRFASYVSSRAIVCADLQLGENCMIHDGAIVQPFVRIGDNCIVRSGAHISHHCSIGSHAFVAARAAIAGEVDIGECCVLGVNCTLRDGIELTDGCFVGAGAVVTRSALRPGLYVGAPARWRGEATV